MKSTGAVVFADRDEARRIVAELEPGERAKVGALAQQMKALVMQPLGMVAFGWLGCELVAAIEEAEAGNG